MRSRDKLLQVPLNRGQSQGAGQDAPDIPPQLYRVENCRLNASGVLEKRSGTRGLAGTVASASQQYLTGNGSSTRYANKPSFASTFRNRSHVGTSDGWALAFDDDHASDYFYNAGAFGTVKPIRTLPRLISTFDSEAAGGFGKYACAQAINSTGYKLVIASRGNAALYGIITNAAGSIVYTWHFSDAATRVKAVAVGATFVVVYQERGATAVKAQTLTFAAASPVTLGTLTQVATLNASSNYFDISAYDATNWFLVHQSASTTLRVDKMAGVTSSANATWTVAGIPPCSVWANPNTAHVWVGYYNDPTSGGQVRYRVRAASDLSEVRSEQTLVTGANIYGAPLFGQLRKTPTLDATAAFWVCRRVESSSFESRGTQYGIAYSDSTSNPTSDTIWHWLPISKPDNFNRVWCTHEFSNDDCCEFSRSALFRWRLADVADMGDVCVSLDAASPYYERPGSTYGPSAEPGYFSAIAVGASENLFAVPLVRVLNPGGGAGGADPIPVVSFEPYLYQTLSQSPWQQVVHGTNALVAAGQPVEIGVSAFANSGLALTDAGSSELGYPDIPIIHSAAASGSGNLEEGSYLYSLVIEDLDNESNLAQCAPAPFETVTTSAGNTQVSLVVPLSYVGQRARDITLGVKTRSLRVYRSRQGEQQLHRMPPLTIASTSQGMVTLTDNVADADIAAQPFLYTDGGALQTDLAPTCRFIAIGETRIAFAGGWNPQIVEFSQYFFPGEQVQPTQHDSHKVFLPDECTGIVYMDGQFGCFTRNNIYVVSGDGPDERGAGAFSNPRSLCRSIGCTQELSILETELGVVFLHEDSFYLLPRGFSSPIYIGAGVRDDVQGGLTKCLGAAVLKTDKYHLARFLMCESDEASATDVLTLDLNFREGVGFQWFRDKYASEMGVIGMWASGFVLVQSNLDSDVTSYPIWADDSSVFGDEVNGSNSRYVQQLIETTTIYPFGISGFGKLQRSMLAMQAIGTSQDVTIYTTTDNNEEVSETWQIEDDDTRIHYRELLPEETECSHFMIRIVENEHETDGDGAGVKLIALTFELEPDGGIRPLAAEERG